MSGTRTERSPRRSERTSSRQERSSRVATAPKKPKMTQIGPTEAPKKDQPKQQTTNTSSFRMTKKFEGVKYGVVGSVFSKGIRIFTQDPETGKPTSIVAVQENIPAGVIPKLYDQVKFRYSKTVITQTDRKNGSTYKKAVPTAVSIEIENKDFIINDLQKLLDWERDGLESLSQQAVFSLYAEFIRGGGKNIWGEFITWLSTDHGYIFVGITKTNSDNMLYIFTKDSDDE